MADEFTVKLMLNFYRSLQTLGREDLLSTALYLKSENFATSRQILAGL